jgi:hypothetical protein
LCDYTIAKNNEIKSKVEICSNYKIYNDELKSDLQNRQVELRKHGGGHEVLKQQNDVLKQLIMDKDDENLKLDQSLILAQQLVDVHAP